MINIDYFKIIIITNQTIKNYFIIYYVKSITYNICNFINFKKFSQLLLRLMEKVLNC